MKVCLFFFIYFFMTFLKYITKTTIFKSLILVILIPQQKLLKIDLGVKILQFCSICCMCMKRK